MTVPSAVTVPPVYKSVSFPTNVHSTILDHKSGFVKLLFRVGKKEGLIESLPVSQTRPCPGLCGIVAFRLYLLICPCLKLNGGDT